MFFLAVDTLFMARSFPIWLMSRDLSFTVLHCVMDFLTAISIDYLLLAVKMQFSTLFWCLHFYYCTTLGRYMEEDCLKRHGEILINL